MNLCRYCLRRLISTYRHVRRGAPGDDVCYRRPCRALHRAETQRRRLNARVWALRERIEGERLDAIAREIDARMAARVGGMAA